MCSVVVAAVLPVVLVIALRGDTGWLVVETKNIHAGELLLRWEVTEMASVAEENAVGVVAAAAAAAPAQQLAEMGTWEGEAGADTDK